MVFVTGGMGGGTGTGGCPVIADIAARVGLSQLQSSPNFFEGAHRSSCRRGLMVLKTKSTP